MVSTASTAPVSSSRSAMRVTMPVHCAPSSGVSSRGAQHAAERAEMHLVRRGTGSRGRPCTLVSSRS